MEENVKYVNTFADVSEMSEEKGEISGTRPCDGLRVDLKRCLLQSDCCLKSKKTPLECLQTNDVSAECQEI